ncbi:MAG: universal stress protein [Fuerstiella sp.]|nr:universal stress protein [Fuerstiella sp.]
MQVLNSIVAGVAMPESRPWDTASVDPATRTAVHQAFHLASSMGIPLQLVTVLEKPEAGFFGSSADADKQAVLDRQDADQVLADLNSDYANLNVRVSNKVVFGQPWFEIMRVAESSCRTLIVCGTRNSSSVSRLLFGTTGVRLLRNASGPVWLVKPRNDNDAVLDVLAATDLSEVGIDVIAAGVALGNGIPVRLSVMHVVDTFCDRQVARAGASEEEILKWRHQVKADAEVQLQGQLAETDFRTLSNGVRTQLTEGVADTCILSAIEELDIDLLIMASSGRGGIPGVLFGNTAERLLSELPCSLLTVKPDDFICPIDLS